MDSFVEEFNYLFLFYAISAKKFLYIIPNSTKFHNNNTQIKATKEM